MFEFFFKYPIPVFTKGKFILLGAWPDWLLVLLVAVSVGGLAWLTWRQLPEAAPRVRNWRGEPAITVAELKSQQNIIAVLVDDSLSMANADAGADGTTARETAAVKTLEDGVLVGLQKKFQTRVYRLDAGLTWVQQPDVSSGKSGVTLDGFPRIPLKGVGPDVGATHINAGLRQLTAETSELPGGAGVVLSDGAENAGGGRGGSGGVDLETINAL